MRRTTHKLLRQLIPKSPNYPADNGLPSKENLFFILYPLDSSQSLKEENKFTVEKTTTK